MKKEKQKEEKKKKLQMVMVGFDPVTYGLRNPRLTTELAKTCATHRQLGIGSVSKKQIKTKIKAKQKQTNKQMTAVEMASHTVFSP